MYGFFAPTALRVAAACVFAYLAYRHFKHKKEIARTRFPFVGEGGWIAWALVLVEGIVALGLLLGYHTQVNALIGIVVMAKHLFWSKKYPSVFMLSTSTVLLLIVILVSLVVSGAGALAFDLPL